MIEQKDDLRRIIERRKDQKFERKMVDFFDLTDVPGEELGKLNRKLEKAGFSGVGYPQIGRDWKITYPQKMRLTVHSLHNLGRVKKAFPGSKSKAKLIDEIIPSIKELKEDGTVIVFHYFYLNALTGGVIEVEESRDLRIKQTKLLSKEEFEKRLNLIKKEKLDVKEKKELEKVMLQTIFEKSGDFEFMDFKSREIYHKKDPKIELFREMFEKEIKLLFAQAEKKIRYSYQELERKGKI